MGLFDAMLDTVKDLPIAGILRQQLVFAEQQFVHATNQVSDLQIKVGKLEAQLERAEKEHYQTQEELHRLQQQLAEDVRIIGDIEFRRGARTGARWTPFCPKCHLPVAMRHPDTYPHCNDKQCGWCSSTKSQDISNSERELP